MLNLIWGGRIIKRFLTQPFESFKAGLVVRRINRLVKEGKFRVVFYDRLAMHDTFSNPVISELNLLGEKVIHLVGDPTHPMLSGEGSSFIFYVNSHMEIFFSFFDVPLMVTAASHISVDSKSKITKFAHIFHSPVSMHYVYGDDAFDAYDIFFAVGPHHVAEIHQLSQLRNWCGKKVYQAGYPKIDKMKATYDRSINGVAIEEYTNDKKVVMFAPSWGEANILKHYGFSIVKELIEGGFHVILRPHNLSFEYDLDVIDELLLYFAGCDFEVDGAIGSDKMLSSDLLISDWSGVAYEYAFTTERPVLFIDCEGAQKINSRLNKEILIKPMEDTCRFGVGVVCTPSEFTHKIVDRLIQGRGGWAMTICETRKQYLYNYQASSRYISAKIRELL